MFCGIGSWNDDIWGPRSHSIRGLPEKEIKKKRKANLNDKETGRDRSLGSLFELLNPSVPKASLVPNDLV